MVMLTTMELVDNLVILVAKVAADDVNDDSNEGIYLETEGIVAIIDTIDNKIVQNISVHYAFVGD